MINKTFANKIVEVALQNGMPEQLSKLIACQSAFETNNFTSNAFKKNNNGFGYKYYEGSKYQLGKGIQSTEADCYASYKTFDDSISEVCSWIKRRQKEGKFPSDLTTIKTASIYAKLLKGCGYYGSKEAHYAQGTNKYLKAWESLS